MFFGGIGEGWCDTDPQMNSFLLLAVTSVPILVKIDQEMQL